jgi:membrane protein
MRRSILLLIRAIARKFFADRGTHLAAMIAYFALLSFVPLLFLSLAVLSTAGQANSGSFFIRELHRTFPSTSLDSLLRAVRAIRENATALGIFGVAFLAWSSLSLFSVLESAFNIVYGRPNRPFLRGKLLATMMMVGSLAFLFASLVVGSVGAEILRRYTGFGDSVIFANAVSVGVSLVGVFIFLSSAYVVLTNDDLSWREVVLGAAVAAAVLEATFQLLPAFVRVSKHNPVVQTLSGPAVLLIWLYVMANVIVLGAEINWHRRYGVLRAAPAPRVRDASAPVSSRRRAPRPSGRARRG